MKILEKSTFQNPGLSCLACELAASLLPSFLARSRSRWLAGGRASSSSSRARSAVAVAVGHATGGLRTEAEGQGPSSGSPNTPLQNLGPNFRRGTWVTSNKQGGKTDLPVFNMDFLALMA